MNIYINTWWVELTFHVYNPKNVHEEERNTTNNQGLQQKQGDKRLFKIGVAGIFWSFSPEVSPKFKLLIQGMILETLPCTSGYSGNPQAPDQELIPIRVAVLASLVDSMYTKGATTMEFFQIFS